MLIILCGKKIWSLASMTEIPFYHANNFIDFIPRYLATVKSSVVPL